MPDQCSCVACRGGSTMSKHLAMLCAQRGHACKYRGGCAHGSVLLRCVLCMLCPGDSFPAGVHSQQDRGQVAGSQHTAGQEQCSSWQSGCCCIVSTWLVCASRRWAPRYNGQAILQECQLAHSMQHIAVHSRLADDAAQVHHLLLLQDL